MWAKGEQTVNKKIDDNLFKLKRGRRRGQIKRIGGFGMNQRGIKAVEKVLVPNFLSGSRTPQMVVLRIHSELSATVRLGSIVSLLTCIKARGVCWS